MPDGGPPHSRASADPPPSLPFPLCVPYRTNECAAASRFTHTPSLPLSDPTLPQILSALCAFSISGDDVISLVGALRFRPHPRRCSRRVARDVEVRGFLPKIEIARRPPSAGQALFPPPPPPLPY